MILLMDARENNDNSKMLKTRKPLSKLPANLIKAICGGFSPAKQA